MALIYLKNVVTLRLDTEKCDGCGMCLQVCPHAVFHIEKRKAVIGDRDACMECGACTRNCAAGALFVQAGVGCATAVINSKIHGTQPACGCSDTACCN